MNRYQTPEQPGDVVVRVGMPAFTGRMWWEVNPETPKLVSANAIWRRSTGQFADADMLAKSYRRCALDSAGFVATRLYGGAFPWALEQYVELGALHAWDWWAQMDLCCEPEVASDRATVRARVAGTAELLVDCLAHAKCLREYEGAHWATDPLPVLQGWMPEDYQRSAELADGALGGVWPALVGVGSVCRRGMTGPAGVPAVVRALDAVLPSATRLHLFGVKSDGLRELSAHPRVAPVDSCAWDFAARIEARKAGVSNDTDHRLGHLRSWLGRQLLRKRQPVQIPML